jgi:predicted ATP-dependent serine protease
MPNFPGVAVQESTWLVKLSEANEANVERIDVGYFNKVFGGGLARTSVNLIAGPPGAGKTTLFLMLSDLVTNQVPGEVLYIANEMSPDELKLAAKRLQIQNLDRIWVLNAMGGLQVELGQTMTKIRPCLIILDSLTKMISEDQAEAAVHFVERFKEYTVALKSPTLIVNQVTKGGDHAGLNKVLHAGDALFYLDKNDHSGQRELYSTKNRFGPAPETLNLVMMAEDSDKPGFLVPDPEVYKEDEDEE